jgi:catechol 2,3-dioxygenase-like lactoylglutathione lyase family enzyme
MFLYITLGTNDLARARRFYDAVMPCLGFVLRGEDDREIGYGPADAPRTPFWITRPFDGKPATVGNGSMPSFTAPDRAAVDAFYRAALDHGGSDEGAPGERYRPGFYACYVRDADGNKMAAIHETP